MSKTQVTHRIAILIALFTVAGCTQHASEDTTAVTPPPTTAVAPAPSPVAAPPAIAAAPAEPAPELKPSAAPAPATAARVMTKTASSPAATSWSAKPTAFGTSSPGSSPAKGGSF